MSKGHDTAGDASLAEPLYTPTRARVDATAMQEFINYVATETGSSLAGYDALHDFSVSDPERFWALAATYLKVPFIERAAAVMSPDPMPFTRWFEGSTLNYAQALLYPPELKSADETAIISVTEGGTERRLSWRELRELVAAIQAGLTREGVKEGDAVAAYAANVPETVALLLACAGLGAVFTTSSPDFGAEAAAARFAQQEPKLLFATTHYQYGGKRHDTTSAVTQLAALLPGSPRVISLPYGGEELAPEGFTGFTDWLSEGGAAKAGAPTLKPLPFDHPLYVLYSSGTTGIPKAMVHRAGGALLTHMKEHRLHSDIRPHDVVFYFTTCGWMMWNWLVSVLAQAATIVLYDGSPAWPDMNAQFDLAERLKVTFFGTSARFISEAQAAGLEPKRTHDLTNLKTLASTGSPLSPEAFKYVYREIKPDMHLASISGGTDIVSCFMLGVPTLPVYAGQIQRPGLGVALRVLGEAGEELVGESGELVCAAPLPSMPLRFLGDPDYGRYEDAYFRVYPGVWRHGDLVERTREGGVVVYGRSDATLNPGGVRIGTAEIYGPLEQLPAIREAAAVGRRSGADEETWLLVTLAPGYELTAGLIKEVKGAIRRGASPRHVPRRVIDVPELPRTRSGKAMEMAVAKLVNGQEVTNTAVMANPESVSLIRGRLDELGLA